MREGEESGSRARGEEEIMGKKNNHNCRLRAGADPQNLKPLVEL
jgi:hypothetical protein